MMNFFHTLKYAHSWTIYTGESNISAQGTASDVTKDTAATGVIETVTDVKAVIDTDEARPPPPSYNEHM